MNNLTLPHCIINTQYPQNIAVVTESNERISYEKLLNDVNTAAEQLTGFQRIFIIAKNDYIALVYYFAAIQSKTVVLLLGADTPKAQLSALITKYQPCCLLMHDSITPLETLGYQYRTAEKDYHFLTRKQQVNVKQFGNLRLLLSTSGSTGCPKLVRISEENLLSNTDAIVDYLNISAEQIALAHLPFYYSYGLSVINSHLRAGACIVLSNHAIVSPQFWQQMKEQNITSLSGVPFHFEMLLKLRFERQNLPYLNTLTQAGGKLENRLLEKVANIAKQKSIRFFVMYGQTEASPRMTYLAPEQSLNKLGSIGKPIPGGKVTLAKNHSTDVEGELIYHGKNVCLGYASCLEDLTKGDENQGVLHTGDMAFIDEGGFIFLRGRKSRFLKVFGKRIALDELEHLISQLGYKNIVGGNDDHLKIYLVTHQQDLTEIKQQISREIGVHLSAISITPITEIPRLRNGKVDYQWLTTHK